MIKVEFIGTAGGSASPYRNFPCIALTHNDHILLLDVGEGSSTNLMRQGYDLSKIDYCLISHMHVDHFLGLHSLLFKKWLLNPSTRTTILLPENGSIALNGAFVCMSDRVRDSLAMEIQELAPSTHRLLEPQIELFTLEVPHGFAKATRHRAYAYKLIIKGRSIVYTGDTCGSNALREFAQGADLLISEATFLDNQKELANSIGHLTASQAANIAQDAGVSQLILTHREPGPSFNQTYYEQASSVYSGQLQLAEDNLIIVL